MDPAQRAWLHQVRWRREPVSRRRVAALLMASVLLNALGLLALSRGMHPHAQAVARSHPGEAIEVRLHEARAPAAPSPPPPAALPDMTVRAPSRPRTTPPPPSRPPPPAVDEKPNPQAAAAQLFDRQGKVILPQGAVAGPASSAPAYQAGILNARSRPAQPQSPVKYQATRFEQAWVPDGENILQSAVRRTLLEGTVMKLPGGYKFKCALSPLALAGGCGIADPEQLSAPLHVEFKRNNLPSATPLIRPSERRQGRVPGAAASTPAGPASAPRPASTSAPPAAAPALRSGA